jgi:hypothetical protein
VLYIYPTEGWEVVVPRNPEIRWNDKRKDLLFGVKRESEAKLVSLWGKRSDTEILHEMQPEEWVAETVWYTLGRGLRWIPTYFPGAGIRSIDE